MNDITVIQCWEGYFWKCTLFKNVISSVTFSFDYFFITFLNF